MSKSVTYALQLKFHCFYFFPVFQIIKFPLLKKEVIKRNNKWVVGPCHPYKNVLNVKTWTKSLHRVTYELGNEKTLGTRLSPDSSAATHTGLAVVKLDQSEANPRNFASFSSRFVQKMPIQIPSTFQSY